MPNRPQASEPPAALANLIRACAPGARLLSVRLLGTDEAVDLHAQTASQKGTGYGAPLLLELETEQGLARWVLHTATPNPFGHDRRADRAAEMLLAYDTFPNIPQHARVLDVGAYLLEGGHCSLRNSGEFYLLTEWVVGEPYAQDLRRIADRARSPELEPVTPADRRRAEILASYLAALHKSPLAEPTVPAAFTAHAEGSDRQIAYRRAARDLFGSGEGLFGIRDGYPDATPGAPNERLDELERRALRFRSRLRQSSARLCRIHGDFHPFNIVFGDRDELRLLDASRGCLGDPADDLVCLSINYLFFGLISERRAAPGFAELFRYCFATYFAERPDPELLEIAPPFLAWRALVLANPTWYPDVSRDARERLLTFVEATLDAGRLDLQAAQECIEKK